MISLTKRLISVIASLIIAVLMISNCTLCYAEAGEKEAPEFVSGSQKLNGYSAYKQRTKGWNIARRDVPANLIGQSYPVTLYPGDKAELSVNLPQDALYELRLVYRCLSKSDVMIALSIDGKTPFDEAESLRFPAMWIDDGEARRDEYGNEFAPDQKLYEESSPALARDFSGQFEDPYRFALAAGSHTIIVTVKQGEVRIDGTVLAAPEAVDSYQDPKEAHKNDELIILEGEDAALKNDRALIPLSEKSADVSPSHSLLNKLNYIGGTNWDTPGKALTWEFDVANEGYYTIKFLFRQNQLLGGVAFRHLLIDGKTPFAEAKRVKFSYDNSWQEKLLGSGEEPYLIWLEKGRHTLTLVSTTGPMAEVYSDMREVSLKMGDLYVDITMITGETVDVYRSYELFKQIPDFNDRLDEILVSLDNIINRIKTIQEASGGSILSVLQNARRVVQQMRNKPYSSHRYRNEFYDAYTNISALMGTISSMPLDIDRIVLSGEDAKLPRMKPTFFEKLSFTMNRFVQSFVSDYQEAYLLNDDELTLWLNWGRDQVQVLNALIQDDFVRREGIPVRVRLVNATLIQAILAGTGPDCMLQMQRTEPVNLAMRGALLDLNCFEDQGLKDVLKRFSKDAEIPYRYNGGLYALPDTQSFYMMFLRTDILKPMGLGAPKTWDEFINVAMLLQRKNLQVSMPNITITDPSLFPTLLAQSNLSLYREDNSGVALGDKEQIQVFARWTEWYTKYKMPVITDFFNRFRIGSAPIGIASYIMYNQLVAAAPEIEGRWEMVEIPGTQTENGINSASVGAGTGCGITAISKNPDNAWKFLKWWTDAQTQVKFSENIESILGPLGRVATSNLKATVNLGWDEQTRNQLERVQLGVRELPEVPGGYYTFRGINQAFWGVVEQGSRPADAITKWAEVINREIKRKTAEYSK